MIARNAIACLSCLAFVLSGGGCSKSDTEVLGEIGRKIVERTHLASENTEPTWTKMPNQLLTEVRVRERLHWDKMLADAVIEVKADDKTVELKGTLATPEQIRRAGELAESTVGVEKVVNSLAVKSD